MREDSLKYAIYRNSLEKQIDACKALKRSGFIEYSNKEMNRTATWADNPMQKLFEILYYSLISELIFVSKVDQIQRLVRTKMD